MDMSFTKVATLNDEHCLGCGWFFDNGDIAWLAENELDIFCSKTCGLAYDASRKMFITKMRIAELNKALET